MRYSTTLLLSLAVALPASVFAQPAMVASNFASNFEKIVDNCQEMGITLTKARVTITPNAKRVAITIPSLPIMRGKLGKHGKLRAAGANTQISIRAQYGFNGRMTDKKLQAVLVAEFFKNDKPQCTQSWSVTGKRSP